MSFGLKLSKAFCTTCKRSFYKTANNENCRPKQFKTGSWKYATAALVGAGGVGVYYFVLDSYQRRLLKVTASGVVRFLRFGIWLAYFQININVAYHSYKTVVWNK